MRKYELDKENTKLTTRAREIRDDLACLAGRMSDTSREVLRAEAHRVNNRLQVIRNELEFINGGVIPVLVSREDEPTVTYCDGAE